MKKNQWFVRLQLPLALIIGLSFALVVAMGGLRAPAQAGPPSPWQLVPISTDPDFNALDVPIDSSVRVTFTEAISLPTVDVTTFAVHGSQGPVYDGVYSLENGDRTVVLDPDRNFYPGEVIRASATTGILGSGGDPVQVPYTWQFWVETEGDSARYGLVGALFGANDKWTDAIAIGDMDGDGDLDVIAGNAYYQNVIYFNGGAGNFYVGQNPCEQSPIPEGVHCFSGSGDATRSLVLGDIENDGDLDVVVGNNGDQNLIHVNDGAGNMDASRVVSPEPNFTIAVAMGDVNGDGYLDIAVANRGNDDPNMIYFNDGDGTFNTTFYPLGSGAGDTHDSYAIALGDLDGDGDLDAVVGNIGADPDMIYINDGVGNPYDIVSYPFNSSVDTTHALALGDMDGDGDLDIVAGKNGQRNAIYYNDGGASFDAPHFAFGASSDYTLGVALGDLDGDGDLDVVVANDGGQNAVYLNDGHGVLARHPLFYGTGHDNSWSVALGDLDDDGDLDAAVGNAGTAGLGQNFIYRNRQAVYLPLVVRDLTRFVVYMPLIKQVSP
ncbi:MAG: VCBS repeat-containing protein [Anaerolineae bacterium]|nr:VCBS repeat-containing protein [Anaerolineae bacterium]